MTVVAEGVETQEQMDCLVHARVDAIQGYLQARPMTEDALLAWLQERQA
jgi:EAL domain-containing protein (putative c-di-GMP-specific phosphodiesterase class I)